MVIEPVVPKRLAPWLWIGLFSLQVIRGLRVFLHGRFWVNLRDDDRIARVSGSHLFGAVDDRNFRNGHTKPLALGVPPTEVPPALGVSPEQAACWCSYRGDHRF